MNHPVLSLGVFERNKILGWEYLPDVNSAIDKPSPNIETLYTGHELK